MSPSPEDTLPIRRLRELESALAGGAERGECLRLLREVLSPPPDPRDLPPRGESLDALGAAIIQALPIQIAVLDGRGTIVAVNDAWRRFALTNDGAAIPGLGVGASYLEVCRRAQGEGAEDADAALWGIRSVLDRARSLFTLEYACHGPLERRWFLMQATPLPVAIGGALITHLDVTGRRLGEELARRQHAQLAQVARIHTVGALATAVAHEISQPLAAIGIYSNAAAHMLESGRGGTAELVDVLRQIETQVKRAGDIVARIRELTRWRAAEKTRIDLREAVADAVRLARPTAAERQVAIALENAPTPLTILGDRVQIAQALINLLFNAIEAIALADSRERRIGVRVQAQAGGSLVTVQDSGPGIRPGWEERIFDIFETDKAAAPGLGLAISRSLVEGHGGRLWADTQPRDGATFHFTLPGVADGEPDSH